MRQLAASRRLDPSTNNPAEARTSTWHEHPAHDCSADVWPASGSPALHGRRHRLRFGPATEGVFSNPPMAQRRMQSAIQIPLSRCSTQTQHGQGAAQGPQTNTEYPGAFSEGGHLGMMKPDSQRGSVPDTSRRKRYAWNFAKGVSEEPGPGSGSARDELPAPPRGGVRSGSPGA